MKNIISSLIIASAMALSANADNFTVISSGDWTNPDIWENGTIPTADDSVIFYNGATVDVTTEVSVAESPWTDHNATLNITGENATLTYTGTFTMFGNTRMEFNVSDGATLDVAKFNWGTGGYSNFNITNGGVLNTTFDQFSGSAQGSTIKVDNGAILMKSQWNVGANVDGQKLDIIVSGANAVMKASTDGNRETLRINATGTSEANVIFSNGASANIYDLNIGNFYSNSGKNSLTIYGAGTNVKAQSINVGKAGETVESYIQFGGFDAENNFVAAGAGSLVNGWEVKIAENGKLKFLLGAENAFQKDTLENADKANAIFQGQYVKSMQADAIELDFSNVEGLQDGEYWFAILSSSESIEGTNNTFNDVAWDWDSIIKITNTGDMVYNGYQILDNTVFVNMSMVNVPEPSTYAMIFGALALAFAAYRRRK